MYCRNTTNLNDTFSAKSPEEQLYNDINYYISRIAIPIVCGFGILGNMLNIIVLTREKVKRSLSKMEKSAHLGMIALAFSDYMFCLLALLFTILPLSDIYPTKNLFLYYEWLGSPMITIFIISSTVLIVMMAAERYIAVCHPFKARRIISLRRTRIIIIMIFICCSLATLPIFFETVIEECKDTKEFKIVNHKLFTNQVIGIRRICWSVVFDFLPCGLLIYFNTCLIWKIHQAKNIRLIMAQSEQRKVNVSTCWEQHSSCLHKLNKSCSNEIREHSTFLSRGNDDFNMRSTRSQSINQKRKHAETALNSVTATLVAIVVLFLVLVSPSEIMKYVFFISNTQEDKKYMYNVIRSVTNFMQALNFSVNFILYCVMNKFFRETLVSLFCFYNNKFHITFTKKSEFPTISLQDSSS